MADEFFWIDADGTSHALSEANGAAPLFSADGRFMPPISFVEEEVPLQPGARLRHVKTGVREYAQAVMFTADSEAELRDELRAWLHRFNPDRGDGRMRVMDSQGALRELACRYSDGMQMQEAPDTSGRWFQKAVIVFRAVDPYWYDSSEVSDEFGFDADPVSFFPFFPITIASSEVFAAVSVDNTGDVEAWPVWEVHGPTVDLRLHNLTTGKVLSVTHEHAAGEVLTIDTRPGVKTVTMDDGTNLYGMLDDGSSLWPLARGPNAVRIEMSGATEDSSVVLRYQRRHLGA